MKHWTIMFKYINIALLLVCITIYNIGSYEKTDLSFDVATHVIFRDQLSCKSKDLPVSLSIDFHVDLLLFVFKNEYFHVAKLFTRSFLQVDYKMPESWQQ